MALNRTETQDPVQQDVRRCTYCIIDSGDDPDISFDSNGRCNYCREWDARASRLVVRGEKGTKEVARIIDDIKKAGKGRKYDCIVGISGGVDSTYLAYKVKEYGLRALAVHFDNGWNSELAVKNIENVVNKLGFDLYTYVVDWNEFRDLQLAYLRASVVDIEAPTDHAFKAVLYDLCWKHKIKHFLWGCNVATEGLLPRPWRWSKWDLANILSIHKRYGTGKLKTFPKLSFWKSVFYQYFLGVQPVALLNYIDYKRDTAKNIIMDELDWRDYGGKHYESVFTRFYQGYILPTKFGIDKRKAHLSCLICSGQITRQQALAEYAKPPYDPAQLKIDKEFVLKKFQLTSDEFEKIMSKPPRSHLDFDSYETGIYRTHENIFAAIRPLTRLVRALLGKQKKPSW